MTRINLKTGTQHNPFDDIEVHNESEQCPYLETQTARMPLSVPVRPVTPRGVDMRLATGQRRSGPFVYVTACKKCRACEPIRIDIDRYEFSKSNKRVLRRNDAMLVQRKGPVICEPGRARLFNLHRHGRGLARLDRDISLEDYRWSFGNSCFDSFELNYSLDDQIVSVAICDRGQNSVSAVYTYFDPSLEKLGLGTYSILKQIEFCQKHDLKYLYLGFYVADSPKMNYKSRFRPHQRRIDGQWIDFD